MSSKIYLSLIAVLFSITSSGQNNKLPVVDFTDFRKFISVDSLGGFQLVEINILGNKKTKDYIILREMNMKVGDTIQPSMLYEKLLLCQEAIYNTNLFSFVQITPAIVSNHRFSININLTEKWFIYPIPQFQIIDRNFNEWLKTYKANFNRVIYGLRYTDYNFSGRADKLNIIFLNGYSRYFSFGYSEPYSNSKLNQGFSVGAGFIQYKEFAYNTNSNNKLVFYKKNYFTKSNFFVTSSFLVRNGLYKKHLFGFQYNATSVSDSFVIKKFNPNYFNDSISKIDFPDFSYSFVYAKTDNINYPLKGTLLSISLVKRGWGINKGINMLSADFSYKKFYSHKSNFYSSFQFFSKIKLPFYQAYINQRALGYGEYNLRGLEYYVVDAVASSIVKLTFSKKILQTNLHFPFKNKFISAIPLSIYAKTYSDAGYAYNKKDFATQLNNRLLYTGGAGFDIITLYDMKLSIEFSINQMNGMGLFLHSRGVL